MKNLFKTLLKGLKVSTILAFAIILSISGCSKSQERDEQYVVILSLDGFRWDYPELVKTPNLDAIAKNGVKAEGLIPCYPTKTFPNHYSMATGLHPNNHGIVCNRFFDVDLGYYAIGDRNAVENPKFYGGEPFWLTAERQGLKAATFYWVGSEAPIGGNYPTFWKRYDQSIPFENRIDTVIHWLTLPKEQRPNVIGWYSHEPDWTAHRNGATGEATLAMVEQLDSLIGIFLNKISELPHVDLINIMIVSDHGMADISPDRYINLSKYIERDWFEFITGGNPVFSLKPYDENREKALRALKSIPNLKVWERHEVPSRLVYGSNPRIQDIIIEAAEGWSLGFTSDSTRFTGATHGWDNKQIEMMGIFYAQGPAFKKGYKHQSFSNTNLYSIITFILGLEPAQTDGNMKDVKGFFRKN
jgi:predicted AlkP superfamily pyrophosphatase or phosphodiesterase